MSRILVTIVSIALIALAVWSSWHFGSWSGAIITVLMAVGAYLYGRRKERTTR
jgi:cation transport ATPase